MILIIEDHEDTRNALVEFLSQHDISTIGVRDGDEALDFMKSKVPYLVVLDWHMPKMSGFDVLCEMQKDARLKNTPTIFYTGDCNQTLKEEAIRAGARRVLVKGSDWNDLIDEIAELTSVRPLHYQD